MNRISADTLRRSVRITALVAGLLAPPLSVQGSEAKAPVARDPTAIVFTEDAADESADGLACYKIDTPTATYYLEKSGAGISSLLDTDGTDWISFHPAPGSGAGGEYRGFPNAVHRQAGSFFHPKNAGTDPSTTKVEFVGAKRVTITAASTNGAWSCRYDFFVTHCTFTMTAMPTGFAYWVLYEGTPGGTYNDTDWWMTSNSPRRWPLTENHEGDIPAPEWIVFGDVANDRSIFLLHHLDDEHPDRFYQMNQQMTVFGFGRQGINKHLDSVPQQFSIGLLPTVDHNKITQQLAELLNP